MSLLGFEDLAPLSAFHDLPGFQSSEPVLNDWLLRRAAPNAAIGASRTYVICPSGSTQVAGYFALSMGQVLNRDVPGAMRRNMPHAIPAVILGRLAVDRRYQRLGLGGYLLSEAAHRAVLAGQQVAARLLVVQAISREAEAFYVHHGFVRLPLPTPTLALDLVKYGG